MQLTESFWAMCERFVDQMYVQTGLAAIVCDSSGTIRKAQDTSRIGKVHKGAQAILSGASDYYAVTAEEAKANTLIKEGYNCAITLGDQRVATFGIGGNLEITKPVARTAALVLSSWIEQIRQNEIVQAASHKFAAEADRLSESVRETTAEFERVNDAISLAGKKASDNTRETEKLLRSVEQIAEQIHIISLNARIEASRLSHGEVFKAISDEMTTLARTAQGSAQNAQRLLDTLKASINDVAGAVDQSSQMFERNVKQSHAIVRMIKELHQSIETLNDVRFQ